MNTGAGHPPIRLSASLSPERIVPPESITLESYESIALGLEGPQEADEPSRGPMG